MVTQMLQNGAPYGARTGDRTTHGPGTDGSPRIGHANVTLQLY